MMTLSPFASSSQRSETPAPEIPQCCNALSRSSSSSSRHSVHYLTLAALCYFLAVLVPHAADGATSTSKAIVTTAGIARLGKEEAAKKIPVQLRGTVTYNNAYFGLTFLEDATGGIFIDCAHNLPPISPGTLVEVDGQSDRGHYTPIVVNPTFRVLGNGSYPNRPPVPLSELWRGNHDCRWVTVRAYVKR